MKFQCEACERLVPLEVFRVEAGTLLVTCGRCGADSRAQVPASAAGSAPVAMGGASMPREGAGASSAPPPDSATAAVPPLPARASSPALRVVRDVDTASRPATRDEELFEPPPGHCPKCVAPRREGSEACAQCGLVYANYLEHEHRPSDVLAGAWRDVVEHWEDAAAHERLMTLALGRGELAMVGRLYRLRLARAPGDAVARRGRDEVVRRATLAVPLASERSGPPAGSRRLKAAAAAVLFLVVMVLAALVFQHLRAVMTGP